MGEYKDVKDLKHCKPGITYSFNVTRGDHSYYMQLMVDNLQEAMVYGRGLFDKRGGAYCAKGGAYLDKKEV